MDDQSKVLFIYGLKMRFNRKKTRQFKRFGFWEKGRTPPAAPPATAASDERPQQGWEEERREVGAYPFFMMIFWIFS
jgi:hypothetical protein